MPTTGMALALAGVKQMDWPADGLSLMVKGKVECVHEVLGLHLSVACRLMTVARVLTSFFLRRFSA